MHVMQKVVVVSGEQDVVVNFPGGFLVDFAANLITVYRVPSGGGAHPVNSATNIISGAAPEGTAGRGFHVGKVDRSRDPVGLRRTVACVFVFFHWSFPWLPSGFSVVCAIR